jgi:hypothetical protein
MVIFRSKLSQFWIFFLFPKSPIHTCLICIIKTRSRISHAWAPLSCKPLKTLGQIGPRDVGERVKYVDFVRQYFRRENNKELTFQRVLMWPALFLLITTLLGDVASGLK